MAEILHTIVVQAIKVGLVGIETQWSKKSLTFWVHVYPLSSILRPRLRSYLNLARNLKLSNISQNIMKPTQCTPTYRELSNGTKSGDKSHHGLEDDTQNK